MSTLKAALPMPPQSVEPAEQAEPTTSGALDAEGDTSATPPSSRASRFGVTARLRSWIETLQHDPGADERASEERRRRLLDHLSRTVAEAPDDTPIKDVIRQLNRHWDD